MKDIWKIIYNTEKNIIRLNHSVLEFSDRDIVSYYRNIMTQTVQKDLTKNLQR